MKAEIENKIKAVIIAIPEGYVASYGQVASLAGIPRGHRVVARFLREYTGKEKLPWFRILRADGYLGMAPGSAGFLTQSSHLKEEGILLRGNRVDMKKHQWQPDLDFFLFHPDL